MEIVTMPSPATYTMLSSRKYCKSKEDKILIRKKMMTVLQCAEKTTTYRMTGDQQVVSIAGAIIEAKVTYLGSVFLVSYRLLSKVMTVSYPL